MREKIGKTDNSALTGKDKGKKKKYNPRVTCFNCGKRGHIATDCHSPKKEGAGPKDQANEATDVSATDDLFAFPVVEEAYPATDQNTWLADSGCTSHITKSRDYFVDFTETPGHQIHGLGNIAALGRGTVKLISLVNGKEFPILLKDCLYAPQSPHNLMSLSRVTEAGNKVTLSGTQLNLISQNGVIFARAEKIDRLYHLGTRFTKPDIAMSATQRTWNDWHKILAHTNIQAIQTMKQKGLVEGLDVNDTIAPDIQCTS